MTVLHGPSWRQADMIEFEAFPKIPRLNRNMTITEKIDRNMTITEKIDGANACIVFQPVKLDEMPLGQDHIEVDGDPETLVMVACQSRKRLIKPGDDNFGFAAWVYDNVVSLFDDLGPGRHYGEWWGLGIQRGYGLDHKRFSLFNTKRWAAADGHFTTPNLHVVPVLDEFTFDTKRIDWEVAALAVEGSRAAPGYMDPEGVVVYHHASGTMAKVTCKNDEKPKGAPDGA